MLLDWRGARAAADASDVAGANLALQQLLPILDPAREVQAMTSAGAVFTDGCIQQALPIAEV